jgi:hypothetical protein
MDGLIHVSVWLLATLCVTLGWLGALAWKGRKTAEVKAESIVGLAEAKVTAFDKGVYDTLLQYEQQGKADVGSAAKYLENAAGLVLKKVASVV